MFPNSLNVARKYGAKVAATGALVVASGAALAEDPTWMTEAAAKAAANGVAAVAVVGAIALAGLAIWGAKWAARKLGFL